MRFTIDVITSPSDLIFFVTASGSPPMKLVNCPLNRLIRSGSLKTRFISRFKMAITSGGVGFPRRGQNDQFSKLRIQRESLPKKPVDLADMRGQFGHVQPDAGRADQLGLEAAVRIDDGVISFLAIFIHVLALHQRKTRTRFGVDVRR